MRLKNIQASDLKNIIRELKDSAMHRYTMIKEIKYSIINIKSLVE